MQNVIEFKNVDLKYKDDAKIILKNLTFDIPQGKMIAIVGPSGIGKSTLFKCLIKTLEPSSGFISLFDQNPYKTDKKTWKKIINKIGFLTQKPNLINTDSVFNNVKRSVSQYKNKFYALFSIITKQQKLEIFEKLNDLGILSKAFYRVSDLSGGQQQRVEIAKLLIKQVELILADEPTSNLDYQTSCEVLTFLRQLNKKLKITILINIHDLELALKFFDDVIVINNQKIIYYDSCQKINKETIITQIQK